MTTEEIKSAVEGWILSGILPEPARGNLKALYLRNIGTKPNCAECKCFWRDVKHHFLFYLKSQNVKISMKNKGKYMVIGSYRPFGFGGVLVNGKGDGVNRIELTDEIAKSLLAADASHSGSIVENPDYDPVADEAEKAIADAKEAEEKKS